MIRNLLKLFPIILLISCETPIENIPELDSETTTEVDCESIFDSLECLTTDGCKITIKCVGTQFCDLIEDQETCEIFWCDFKDGKCLPEGDGSCSESNCPILKGCRLVGKCVKE